MDENKIADRKLSKITLQLIDYILELFDKYDLTSKQAMKVITRSIITIFESAGMSQENSAILIKLLSESFKKNKEFNLLYNEILNNINDS